MGLINTPLPPSGHYCGLLAENQSDLITQQTYQSVCGDVKVNSVCDVISTRHLSVNEGPELRSRLQAQRRSLPSHHHSPMIILMLLVPGNVFRSRDAPSQPPLAATSFTHTTS